MWRFLMAVGCLTLAGCEEASEKLEEVVPEVCGNGEDDDGDGDLDCADPDCASSCVEACANGLDDDGDGSADCADDDCDGLCPEACADGRDNDGDGQIDCLDLDCLGSCPEDCADLRDNDGDGYIDCLDEDCAGPACPEICDDGWDNDGDALVDCDDGDCNSPACPEICDDGRDNDGDGRADCEDLDCDGDCPEICNDGRDNDADGLVDCSDDECASTCDGDGDGFIREDYGGDDCDDSLPQVNPSRPEICNGAFALDDDCDGLVDEDDPDIDALSLGAWGRDNDGDGYGTGAEAYLACQPDPGFGTANTDCDDNRPDVNPSMPEICNPGGPLDDDCDGLIDDADPDVSEDSYLSWFADRDADGYGSGVDFVYACSRPAGTAATDDDCDDADPSVGPPSLWYGDGDLDGFGAGAPVSPTPTCDPPRPGLSPDWVGLDCDDRDRSVFPGAEEICEDGIDQDCDGRDGGCDFVLFVTDLTIGSSPDSWLESRLEADLFCADYAARNGIAGSDFRIVYSTPTEDARDFMGSYDPSGRVFDRYGAEIDPFDLWDRSSIRLPDMKSWTITGTEGDGTFLECSGSYPPGSWPICQYCAQKFACGSSSDNPFSPSACCWTGTRAVVCTGSL